MSLQISIAQLLNSNAKAELNKQAKSELCGRCKLRQRRRTTTTGTLTSYCKECAVEVNREIDNKPFRRHALAYDAIKELLMNADKPLTSSDILESFHNKKLVRKVPAVDKTITFQNPSYTFAEPPAEEPTVPEILVTATSVVIKTSKIKITVEY